MTILLHNYVTLNTYYYNPVQFSSNAVLIIISSNFFNTVSGVVFCVSDRAVCRLRGSCYVMFYYTRWLHYSCIVWFWCSCVEVFVLFVCMAKFYFMLTVHPGKSQGKWAIFIKIWQEWRVLHTKTDTHFWSYLAQFFLEWEMFQTKVVEKIKTHILFSVTFFRKSCRLWDNVENIL